MSHPPHLTAARHRRQQALLLALFSLLYYLPLLAGVADLNVPDGRAALMLRSALVAPPLQLELARNTLTHLLLVLPLAALLCWAARRWVPARRTATFADQALALLLGWLWLMVLNGCWFPASRYSSSFAALAQPAVAILLSLMMAVLLGGATWRAWGRPGAGSPGARRKLALWLLLLAAGLGGLALAASRPPAAQPGGKTIVLLGIDSLSGAAWAREQARMPVLRDTLAQATLHSRAYTLLGRTYPAWATILSGQPPAEHGAVFNLRALDHVKTTGLLSHTLRAQGYRTVLALDERRFNNMDERFGFDAAVGPRAGLLDFMLQRFNDTPLTNALLQTRLAAWTLPFSHLNVASEANYDADGYVDEILRQSATAPNLFLAVHLLSAHFPYHSRHVTEPHPRDNALMGQHVDALTVVDRQIGQLLSGLKRAGRLDDALVIVLSDHGEALGDPEWRTDLQGRKADVAGYGHGINLLSDQQSRIVLATLRYVNGQAVGPGAVSTDQVSLLDVRATAERFASTGQSTLQAGQPCILVETGLRFGAAADLRTIDVKKLAAEGVNFYELGPQGRMQLREETLGVLIGDKDVGWRCKDHITLYTAAEQSYRSYALDPEGLNPREIALIDDDKLVIDAYRSKLRAQARAGNSTPTAAAAGARP